MVVIHTYKGFSLVRNGTSDYPWNIYIPDGHGFGNWVGFDRTLNLCKASIDAGAFDEDKTAVEIKNRKR